MTNDVEPVRRSSWRRTAVSTVLVLVVVAAFGWALHGQWDDIVEQLKRQHPAVVVAALLVALAGVFMSFLLWRGTLVVLGSSLPRRPAARLFFLTQLGKYLPGAVWPVLAQMRMGRDLGVPRQRMGLAFLLTLGLSTLVGILVGVAALPALLQAEGRVVLLGLLAVPVLLALLVPRVLNGLLERALRLLRRPGLEMPSSGRDMTRGVGWAIAFWIVYGGHVWVLAVGLGADPWRTLPVAIGGFAIAFSLGPLLVVLPAGAGVREAVMVLLLHSVLSTSEATAVALTSRGILMATDGLLALAAGVTRRGLGATEPVATQS
jgi:glycosyltransferase 2 family protein